jgi:hypothetical protein
MDNLNSPMPKARVIALTILMFWVAVPISIAWSSGNSATNKAGQETAKQVNKLSYRDEPIDIIEVKNRKGKIPLNEKFKDDSAHWLRGLTFTINNSSGKNITYLNLVLSFPQNAELDPAQTPTYIFDLMFGVSPQAASYNDFRRRHPDKVLKQRERLALSLTDEQFEHIMKVLSSLGYPLNVEKLEIWISEVGFDDGTLWKGGKIFKTEAQPNQDGPSARSDWAAPFFLRPHCQLNRTLYSQDVAEQ